MAELALNYVQRHAFAGELDGVGVAELVRREAASGTRLSGKPAEFDARAGARPGPPGVGLASSPGLVTNARLRSAVVTRCQVA